MVGVVKVDDTLYCRYCKWTCDASGQTAALAEFMHLNLEERPKSHIIKLSITDEAWRWLTQTGQQLGYITVPKNNRGIADFVEALSKYDFRDERSYDITLTQQWYKGIEMPRQRAMFMDDSTRQAYLKLAEQFDIRPYPQQQRSLYGRPPRQRMTEKRKRTMGNYSDAALIGPVLEAIGLRWLRAASPLQHRDASTGTVRVSIN